MELKEANKIIAEFMGYSNIEIYQTSTGLCITISYGEESGDWKSLTPYSQSLDALVPVREKLALLFSGIPHYTMIINRADKTIVYKAYIEWVGKDPELLEGTYTTPENALCIAAAKIIKELD